MERFGRYVLFEKLGSGGMADVFRAASVGEAGFVRAVAVKRILPEMASNPDFVKMLIDEASIAAQLHHNNIVQVLDLGTESGLYFMAMEYVVGRTLGAVIRRVLQETEHFPRDAALFIIEQSLRGLAYAHTATDAAGEPLHIIHRDVSPANILIGFDGAVKLSDFGIAKAASRQTETVVGTVKGKPGYMAPEQLAQGQTTQSADIFAMGVVFHELLSGRRLRTGTTDLEVLAQAMRGDFPTFEDLGVDVPEPLANLVYNALAKDPAARWSSASDFAEACNHAQRELGYSFGSSQLAALMAMVFPDEIAAERAHAASQAAQMREVRGSPSGSWQTAVQHTPRTPMPAGPLSMPGFNTGTGDLDPRGAGANSGVFQSTGMRLAAGASTAVIQSMPSNPGTPGQAFSLPGSTPPGGLPGSNPGITLPPGGAPGSSVLPKVLAGAGLLAVLAVGGWLATRPAGAALTVVSDPAGAAIDLDGKPTGKVTPAVIPDVLAGPHEVDLKKEDFVPLRVTVAVTAGEDHKEHVKLVAQDVTVSISSAPPDAEVEVDGAVVARTPYKLVGPAGDRHKVVLRKTGYQPLARDVVISKDNPTWQVELVPDAPAPVVAATPAPAATPDPKKEAAPASKKASGPVSKAPAVISIQSSPWGRVILDGKDLKRFTPLLQFEVAAGTHKVRIVNDEEAASDEFTFTVEPGAHPAPFVRTLK